jgi:hypothetical protein
MSKAAVVDSPRGLCDHIAKALRVEPGATQHRRHYVIVEQLFEARLIAAAFSSSVHARLLTSKGSNTFNEKDVLIMTRDGNFAARDAWAR